MKRSKILALPLAIALGLEMVMPHAEATHPHTEQEIVLAQRPVGALADALRPFVTPPENPWLMDYALRVLKPDELEGWWVNTHSTHTGGYVTNMRTQTCGELKFKDIATIKNLNTNQEITTPVYLNADYCISSRNRKMCEQLQQWMLQRGITAQVVLRVGDDKGGPPDYRTLASGYAPVYDDGDGA